MGRSKLSLKNQLRGVEAALKSKKTPPQFRDGLRRRAADLRKKIGEERDGKPTGLTPVLGRLWDIR